MSKLRINFLEEKRNFKFLRKKYGLFLFISIIVGYCLVVTGSTYAYYFFSGEDTSTLTGDLGKASIDLTVERVVPDTDMPLVPLLDAALGNAIKGNGGVSACIDSNNNLSCEVYQIKVHNPSTTNIQLTADVTLVASGEGNVYNNLKWELLDDVNQRKTEYESYGMGTNVLEDKLYLEVGDTRIYYIAVWISENGTDQRETDKGQYGGIVEFRTSNGQGVTASFGKFDNDYCTNNGITKLSDCILITEKYSDTVDEAKTYISSKVADFTNTAPIITYSAKVEKNVTDTSVVSTNQKLKAGTGYTFDKSTGRYNLKSASTVTMLDALSDEDTTYYVCNDVNNAYCNTMYVIYDATSTTSNGVTTYKATKTDRYTQNMETQNISGKGLYVAEDDYGDSYYFRGKVENNYVSFAGFIWRIVRINGDGSIRLIYSGTSTSDTGSKTSIGTSAFNNDPYDPAMLGYKYGLSKTLQHTTSTGLQYNNISATTVYYFGDDYITNDSTKKLSISGNTTSGTLTEVWGSGSSDYKYTCFSTSSTGTCTTLIEIKSYVNERQVRANYHSYLSKSYESTYTDNYDSKIKTVIDNWYKKNIEDKGYSDYIVDNIFCNDRSITSGDGFSLNATNYYGAYTRNNTNKSPSLKCPRKVDQFTVTSGDTLGNGELTYPVGLLTIDEAAYAGGKNQALNKVYYLYTGQTYWTMSPSDFNSWNVATHGWHVNSDGRLNNWLWLSASYDVRPVINLTSDILITGGNGVVSSPYTVALETS